MANEKYETREEKIFTQLSPMTHQNVNKTHDYTSNSKRGITNSRESNNETESIRHNIRFFSTSYNHDTQLKTVTNKEKTQNSNKISEPANKKI